MSFSNDSNELENYPTTENSASDVTINHLLRLLEFELISFIIKFKGTLSIRLDFKKICLI